VREQNNAREFGLQSLGSSPRVRGTGPTVTDKATVQRFIPAGAGNRDSWRSRR